jgi:hypothetical protein
MNGERDKHVQRIAEDLMSARGSLSGSSCRDVHILDLPKVEDGMRINWKTLTAPRKTNSDVCGEKELRTQLETRLM